MPRSVREYLQHILDETEYLMEASQGISKERFLSDATLQRAFVRSIEISIVSPQGAYADLSEARRAEGGFGLGQRRLASRLQ